MANVLSKGTLFPENLTNEMFNLVKGKSSLAKLCAAQPVPFNGTEMFTFSFDKEIDVVAENGPKSNGGLTITPVSIVPVKVEYGARISDEFLYAAEETRLQYLRAFADGFAAKLARGIDIMALHGFNPRTGTASTVIGTNHFDSKITQTVTLTAGDTDGANAAANADVESAIALVQGNDLDITGMAMAPAFRSALAKCKSPTGGIMFPELAWGSNPGTLNGLPVDTNSTVSFNSNADRAVVGNFRDYFRWGYAKQIPIEVIQYGNPDNDAEAGDLKGHNQVYLRGEAYVGWGILLPDAFARIVAGA